MRGRDGRWVALGVLREGGVVFFVDDGDDEVRNGFLVVFDDLDGRVEEVELMGEMVISV